MDINKLNSVIMPADNYENYIQKTINSIINQIYKNIELIVINGSSKDSIWLKIQKMKEQSTQRFVQYFKPRKIRAHV